MNYYYGTIEIEDGETYVLIDGAEERIPAVVAIEVENGDRVSVVINNHIAVVTGNITASEALRQYGRAIRAIEVSTSNGSRGITIYRMQDGPEEGIFASDIITNAELIAIESAKVHDVTVSAETPISVSVNHLVRHGGGYVNGVKSPSFVNGALTLIAQSTSALTLNAKSWLTVCNLGGVCAPSVAKYCGHTLAPTMTGTARITTTGDLQIYLSENVSIAAGASYTIRLLINYNI